MRRCTAVLTLFTLFAAFVAASAFASSRRAAVSARSTSLGRVLVAANGRTLYLFTVDKGKTSACYGKCAAFWPPLLTSGSPLARAGVKQSLLGTAKRRDGKLQVTYAGHPLYFFVKDAKAGQVNGENVQHAWFVLSVAGAKIAPKAATKAPAPPATTTTSTGGGGYGP